MTMQDPVILPPISTLAREVKQAHVLAVAEATNNLAATIRASIQRVAAMPVDMILTVLNDNLAESAAILGVIETMGPICNASLDAVAHLVNPNGSPRFPARVPLGPIHPEVICIDGVFTRVPPTVIEDTPIDPPSDP